MEGEARAEPEVEVEEEVIQALAEAEARRAPVAPWVEEQVLAIFYFDNR